MKLALCISGLMRTYKETANSVLRHICQLYDTDIFVSTWNILGKSVSKFSRTPTDDVVNNIAIYRTYGNRVRGVIIDDYASYKGVNGLTWQKAKYEWGKANNLEGICRVEHLFAMCYKIKQCNELKNVYAASQHVHYDCVMRCRADMLFNRNIKILEVKPNTIYTPSIYTWDKVNDQFAYGDTKVMDTYSSMHDYIEEYDKLDGMNITCPEYLLQHHLREQHIDQVEVSIPYDLIRF